MRVPPAKPGVVAPTRRRPPEGRADRPRIVFESPRCGRHSPEYRPTVPTHSHHRDRLAPARAQRKGLRAVSPKAARSKPGEFATAACARLRADPAAKYGTGCSPIGRDRPATAHGKRM